MKLTWYPPAETHLPWSLIFRAFQPFSGEPEKMILSALKSDVAIVFGSSCRALLCQLLIKLRETVGSQRNEVAIPGYTCYSVPAAIVRAGLKIKVYDIDPSNLHPEPISLEKNTSERTLGIVSQHLFGIPTPLHSLVERAKAVGAVHIEDAAQSLGGELEGKPLGTFGDFGLFSFGRGKPLPLGGGGALVGNDRDLIASCCFKNSSFGMKTIAFNAVAKFFGNPYLYGIAENLPLGLGRTTFDPEFIQSGMPLSSKRLLSFSDNLLEKLNIQRRGIAKIYQEGVNSSNRIPLQKNSTPVFTRYPLFINSNVLWEKLREYGIRRMYPKAITAEKSISPYLLNQEKDTPGAIEISEKLITLPTHMGISVKKATRILGALNVSLKSFLPIDSDIPW